MGVIGTLGTLPFTCAEGFVMTFRTMSRDLSERFASHDVIGGSPVLEWVGHDAASVRLDIRLDSSLGVPPSLAVKLVKTMMEMHTAWPLIVGPEYLGRFVIESISESRKHFTGIGVCQVAEISLSLKEAA